MAPEYVSIVDLVPKRCAKCIAHFAANPMMTEALASVGISHGKSSGQMAREYYAAFHERGHRDPGDNRPTEKPADVRGTESTG